MLINETDTTYYLDKDGNVVTGGPEGAPAEAVSLLVAPGGSLDEAVAATHGVTGLTSHAEAELTNPVTEEPIALVGGRAYARHLVEGADAAARPRAKMVKGPAENKAAPGPVADAAVPVGPKSAGLDTPPKPVDRKS